LSAVTQGFCKPAICASSLKMTAKSYLARPIPRGAVRNSLVTAVVGNGTSSRPRFRDALPLEAGYDIRTVQELLGHRDVRTTMTYLHVLERGALGVKSPLDRL